ncbi:hypothetical protein Cgig2_024947 [Carnegiea gigantea]|uniref:protein disulfide-isomerase n=1 Tax=Carnegiea gigantea TaxID=171969 RepID=A0A9Q1KD77_9CARY|nr:hypothetical protein Cgig2_024947 [Carnegiea gigantea]
MEAVRLSGRGLVVCLVVVLVAAAGRIQAVEEKTKEEVVLTLDNSNFTDTVSKHDFILAEFYAPWCKFCQKLAPEYEKAASILFNHDPPITLAKTDITVEDNRDLALKFNVQGIPALKILRNGGEIVQNYKGPRDADGIVQYIKKQLGPSSVEIKSKDDVAAVIDEKKIFIAGVFPEFAGAEFENFTKLAKTLQSEYDFGHTLDAKVLPRGDSSVKGPLIRLLKAFDELFADFKDFDLDAIRKFIEEEDMPSVLVHSADPSNEVYMGKFKSRFTRVTMLLNFSSENAVALKSKFYDIAFLLKGGKLGFQIADLEAGGDSLLQRFKLDESRAPLVFIQEGGDKKYFKTNVEPDQLVPWFKKFLDGKVEPRKISQPIPQENNEPVKVVVLDSLQDLVFNSGKEVLLEFYAPWCIHCKNIAPTFDAVATFYENDTNVMVAKFDITLNDIPMEIFEVRGYPTIFFVSSKGKIVEYDYNRGGNPEAFIAFIEENRADKKSKAEDEIQVDVKKESDDVIESKTEESSNAIEEEKDEPTSIKDEL